MSRYASRSTAPAASSRSIEMARIWAGVDAPAAQDTQPSVTRVLIGALTLHHNAARGAGANAATAADTGFAIDNQPAHLCHPLDNLGKFYRLLGRRSLNGPLTFITVGHVPSHDLRRRSGKAATRGIGVYVSSASRRARLHPGPREYRQYSACAAGQSPWRSSSHTASLQVHRLSPAW